MVERGGTKEGGVELVQVINHAGTFGYFRMDVLPTSAFRRHHVHFVEEVVSEMVDIVGVWIMASQP